MPIGTPRYTSPAARGVESWAPYRTYSAISVAWHAPIVRAGCSSDIVAGDADRRVASGARNCSVEGTGLEGDGMPTERMLSWAAAAIGSDARVTDVRSLHRDEAPWLLSVEHAGRTTGAVLRAPTPGVWPFMIATGAAALEAAERHRLSAPRLIGADLDGAQTGAVTTLETVVSGSNAWPAPPSAARLRAAGTALAAVHASAMTPTEHLPFRPRPIAVDDFAADRRNGRMPTTRLLEEADQLLTALGLPAGAVFVHGDVWPGNTVWTGDEAAVLIDWKTAGVGAPGVDLGELRQQLARILGP